jgi:hypothetical protein
VEKVQSGVKGRFMKQRVLAAMLAVAMGLGTVAPAYANGRSITRNLALFGAAAALFFTNYPRKVREKRAEQREVGRRQSAYRDWYYKKYGYYPTQEQFDQWYKQTYGVSP